jgi:hypothetical protein
MNVRSGCLFGPQAVGEEDEIIREPGELGVCGSG